MTRARPFPLDDAVEDSRRTGRGPLASVTERAWPVLARIGELSHREQRAAKSDVRATPRKYRVDAPHRGDIRAAAPVDKHTMALPGLLRVAVGGWRLLDHYKPLVRAAAMFALMAIAVLACAFPALRATRIDPAISLRAE